MKKYIILLASIWIINNAKGQTLYDSLSNLNLDHYASLPVDSILKAMPQSYNFIQLIGYTRGNRIHGLSIYYPSGMSVWIKPKNYVYMNPVDSNRRWDLSKFRKEIASYILVTHPDFNFLRGDYP